MFKWCNFFSLFIFLKCDLEIQIQIPGIADGKYTEGKLGGILTRRQDPCGPAWAAAGGQGALLSELPPAVFQSHRI